MVESMICSKEDVGLKKTYRVDHDSQHDILVVLRTIAGAGRETFLYGEAYVTTAHNADQRLSRSEGWLVWPHIIDALGFCAEKFHIKSTPRRANEISNRPWAKVCFVITSALPEQEIVSKFLDDFSNGIWPDRYRHDVLEEIATA